MQIMSIFFFGHGHAFEHENDGAPRGANINRFVGCVQNEHGSVQTMSIAFVNRRRHERNVPVASARHVHRIVCLA